MSEEPDPQRHLEQWKAEMQAEHADAIANPDPAEDHTITAVAQVNYRLGYQYDAESDTLERTQAEQVEELADPALRSCSCGVRGMTPEEARQHMAAANEDT
jgi:hypothetical protein